MSLHYFTIISYVYIRIARENAYVTPVMNAEARNLGSVVAGERVESFSSIVSQGW